MCGIVGQLNFDNSPVSPVVLKKMTDIISIEDLTGKVIGLMIMLDLVTEDYQLLISLQLVVSQWFLLIAGMH